MATKVKATEPTAEPTEGRSLDEMTLDELKAIIAQKEKVIAAKDEKIDALQGKEEGWLITAPNPEYDGLSAGVQFVNGQAWIARDRVYPRYVREMPSKVEIQKEANERFKFDHETQFKDVEAEFAETAKITSAEFLVKLLTNDFGYSAQFYSKDNIAELDKVRQHRLKERAEVEAKQGKMKDNYDKMMNAYAHIGSV